MKRNFGEWRRMNVLYECDGMNVCTIKDQNKQKQLHHATKNNLRCCKTYFLFVLCWFRKTDL